MAGEEGFRVDGSAGTVCGYAWVPVSPQAAVILLHGLQSHARWFAPIAGQLGEWGVAVYAPDRRGSGSSPGVCGDVRRFSDWFEDVGAVVDLVTERHPRTPLHLVGHCFGANIGLGYALDHPERLRSLVMLTPGLHVLPDYTAAEKVRIALCAVAAPGRRFRVPQSDVMFSRDPAVLEWIHADTLGSRTLTARCLAQTARMVGRLRRHVGDLRVPLLVVEAAGDRIADNARNRALLDRSLRGRWDRITFDAEHLLVAEPCRDQLVESLTSWVGCARVPA
jgi:alpha-beta hydrolase superfamily lysophospholipase